MTKVHSHYENLKVSRDAPIGVIKAAYKALAQENHPDRCKHPDAPRRMQVINDAYAVLSDTTKRGAHDRWIASQVQAAKPATASVPTNVPESSKVENLRSLHRSDLQVLRKVLQEAHESEVARMKRVHHFEKKVGILIGLLISFPIYLAFSSADEFFNGVHADPVAHVQSQKEVPMLRH
jgi:DnaJ-class molecular chaperone